MVKFKINVATTLHASTLITLPYEQPDSIGDALPTDRRGLF